MSKDKLHHLEDYELHRLIGDGSNGVVYLARDKKNDTLCALKEFPIGEASAQRFFRELSFLFTLNHPNIIRCLNLIYGGKEKSYLVLEYAELGNLRQHLNKKNDKLSFDETLNFARQMSAALAEAHGNGITHCDIKPENVLLSGTEELPIFKLADLGISQHQNQDKNIPSSTGTPRYMAPEQFYDHPCPASDLYSLGVIIFECLTGKSLFNAVNAHDYFVAHHQQDVDLEAVEFPRWRHVLNLLLCKKIEGRPANTAQLIQLFDYIEFGQLKTTASTDMDLTFSEPCFVISGKAAVKMQSLNTPGTKNIVPQYPGSIWIVDENSIDLYSPLENKMQRQVALGKLTCSCLPAHNWINFNGNLCVWEKEKKRFMRIVSLNPNTIALTEMGQGIFAAATSSQITCMETSGKTLWKTYCANYALEPLLLWDAVRGLWASSGPSKPTLTLWSQDGIKLEEIFLKNPVLALFKNLDNNSIQFVTQGSNSEEPCILHKINSDSGHEVLCSLPKAIYRIQQHDDFFTCFDLNENVHFHHLDGTHHSTLSVDGHLLADVWLPTLGIYALLLRQSHLSVLNCFKFENQPKPSLIHTQLLS
ncbi:MAG: serine/threonine-protein kinase [Blastochloris sp.]|nr:serine/threonine-protein kinase [Blastochloris sp.]